MSDTIIKKANKTENFTIVSNEVPKRNDISARAKGIYFYLMTLPKDWEIHKCEIYGHFTEGRDALDTAFNELMKAGYITQEVKKEKGKFVSFTYTVYEESISGKPLTGNPETVLPETENPHLLSTNPILSTNEQSTTHSKLKRVKKEFIPPTIDEVTEYVLEKQLVIDPYKFANWYTKTDWKDNQGNQIKNWKNKALNWDTRERDNNPSAIPYSKPKEYAKKEEQHCPKCGARVAFGQCTSCGIIIGIDGKEVIL